MSLAAPNTPDTSNIKVTIAAGDGEGAPSITIDYELAKASPFVKDMIEMLAQTNDLGGGDESKPVLPSENLVLMDIEGPLFPTPEVLSVIRDYFILNNKRAFTEVPKPVREPVLETLRPDEATFLRKRVLEVDEFGVLPTNPNPNNNFFQTVMQQTRSVFGGGGGSPSTASSAQQAADVTGGGLHPSRSAPILEVSINSNSVATTTATNANFASSAPAHDGTNSPNIHLFKLKVLRAALFLQLTPLAAAISGWFAWEMTKRVSSERLATKNAATLREFLGVDEDFSSEEKEIIERHTRWPGRA